MQDRLIRWCSSCSQPVTKYGEHYPNNGAFDQYSVPVHEDDIRRANYTGRDPLRVRWNIAFGRHIGTYDW